MGKEQQNKEVGWLRVGAGIDAIAKIYGYRVDQVHQETYKVLGGLHRQEGQRENQQEEESKAVDGTGLFEMLNV